MFVFGMSENSIVNPSSPIINTCYEKMITNVLSEVRFKCSIFEIFSILVYISEYNKYLQQNLSS